MPQRDFLGWDKPFLHLAVDWLLARRDALPGMLLLVPTAQSGRRLRETLAEKATALFTPQVITPGSLLRTDSPDVAPDWVERLAWVETMENLSDWSPYTALFAEPPTNPGEWAPGFASEMVALRRSLQENGLLFSSAALKLRTRLPESAEPGRWQALALLEEQVEKLLKHWGYRSRSQAFSRGISLPSGISAIVLAGISELPPLVAAALETTHIPVTSLIAAPESEADQFSSLGIPIPDWADRTMPWPEVRLFSDPRQQAGETVNLVARNGIPAESLALAAPDPQVGDELARAFTRQGWTTFHPASHLPPQGLRRWLKIWCEWLGDPTLAVLQDLLATPETASLVSQRAWKAKTLAEFRDRRMILRSPDLVLRIEQGTFRGESEPDSAKQLLETAHYLERWRTRFLTSDFPTTFSELLAKLPASDDADTLREWLEEAAPLIRNLRRPARFWLELLLAELPAPLPEAPQGRVLDVQGWLEIFHEPGKHLILCGMNEGMIPARSGGEPWLNENLRGHLGLITDRSRAARDAFLYMAMLQARRTDGSVHVLCGKTGAGGETLLPSRLLLAANPEELPERVKVLFQSVDPPEAGLRWHADWKWTPRIVEPPARIGVTSLGDYLACPFRYYLKHVLQMRRPEPERSEWNARDFGTIAHAVLESWGRDETARASDDPEKIHRWLCAALDHQVALAFSHTPPLAIRIQLEALRQRFAWFARIQAAEISNGWEIVEVERKVELNVSRSTLVAKIDRIDRHRDSGAYRVIDYKTGKIHSIDQNHRKRLKPGHVPPAHLPGDSPAFYETEIRGKTTSCQWVNLQLPLYAAALLRQQDISATPVYFTLGTTENEVALLEWNDFSTDDLEAAETCAEWIVGQIENRHFWPPAEKTAYDDYQLLAAGRTLEFMTTAPASGRSG
ncbi:MAG: PD-(D/E)XK nuclease family protein [Luteolibacter sp.]